jgi:hypothetical protein
MCFYALLKFACSTSATCSSSQQLIFLTENVLTTAVTAVVRQFDARSMERSNFKIHTPQWHEADDLTFFQWSHILSNHVNHWQSCLASYSFSFQRA